MSGTITPNDPLYDRVTDDSNTSTTDINGNKIDISKLTPQELKIYKLYGKLPKKSEILINKLKDRKYFDSGDYAMSKASGNNPNNQLNINQFNNNYSFNSGNNNSNNSDNVIPQNSNTSQINSSNFNKNNNKIQNNSQNNVHSHIISNNNNNVGIINPLNLPNIENISRINRNSISGADGAGILSRNSQRSALEKEAIMDEDVDE
ncbi:unnamed protein product [[Candida] boidinii]|uniref:mRNA stability protein n=1 Tax=Candida boidinii TaxID=5477 RepID=A0A9W6WDP3_CANBO|nr:unnamed protein product [[Candida] boidinii]